MSNAILFTARLPIVFAVLAGCLAADFYRHARLAPQPARAGRFAPSFDASAPRRAAYYGVLTIAFVAFTALAMARLGRF